MQDCGAAAIELNIYYLPGDPHISGRDVEQRHLDILEWVKDAVSVPVIAAAGVAIAAGLVTKPKPKEASA